MRLLQRARERTTLLEAIMLALEREGVLGPGPVDDLDLLGEDLEPLAALTNAKPYSVCSYQPAPKPTSTRPPEM